MKLPISTLLALLILSAGVAPRQAAAQSGPDLATLVNEALQDRSEWFARVWNARAQLDQQNTTAAAAAGTGSALQNGCSIVPGNTLVLEVDSALRDGDREEARTAVARAVDALMPLMHSQHAFSDTIAAARNAERHVDEFLWRAARDQSIRGAWMPLVSDPSAYSRYSPLERALIGAQLVSEVCANDVRNSDALRRLLAGATMPALPFVTLLLIAQHSDHDPALQIRALETLRRVASDATQRRQLALLQDRVALALGREQSFGTQLECRSGTLMPVGLEPSGELDARRATIGLPSLAEYVRSFPSGTCPH